MQVDLALRVGNLHVMGDKRIEDAEVQFTDQQTLAMDVSRRPGQQTKVQGARAESDESHGRGR